MSLQRLCVIGVVAIGASSSFGEEPVTETRALVPVDQGLADINPLAASLRVDTAVHPATDDFAHVYEDPSMPGKYIRSSGAIHAVFDQSTYAVSNGQVRATIPPGTVFYFGPPSAEITPGTRVDMRVPDGTGEASVDPVVRPMRLVYATNSRDAGEESERAMRERIETSRELLVKRTRDESQLTMSDELHRRQRLREIAGR